ncbi:MAG: hypothetical protein P1T08_16890 [Acidimicrobiia bacterium]|nr:hypothetical protein [Acidimicrobiia bacterium]
MGTIVRVALVLVLVVAIAGCGDSGGPGTTSGATVASSAATSTTESTTPPAAATTTTTTSGSTTSSTSSTTTTVTLPPTPIVDTIVNDTDVADPPIDIESREPVVSGLGAASQAAVNQAIRDIVDPRRNQFIADVSSSHDPTLGLPGSSYWLEFEVGVATPEVLSIMFSESIYYEGAAHPTTQMFSITLDPQTGAVFALADVLIPGTIGALALAVEQRVIDDVYGGDSAAFASWMSGVPPELLYAWAVTPTGVQIGFSQYDVGPSALGPQTVVVPYGELAGVVDPAGPAGGLIP